jgi:hypothetical protein
MKLRTLTMCAVAAIIAAISAGAALADPATPADKANGARACQALRTSVTEAIFKSTYGTNADKSNAFGVCVSRWTRTAHQNRHAAETACAAEQADPNFAATHGGKTFAQFYGRGPNGAGALARCINAKRQAATAALVQATENAARKCAAERKLDPAAFKTKYGTNANKSNAFGKCVAKLTHA